MGSFCMGRGCIVLLKVHEFRLSGILQLVILVWMNFFLGFFLDSGFPYMLYFLVYRFQIQAKYFGILRFGDQEKWWLKEK